MRQAVLAHLLLLVCPTKSADIIAFAPDQFSQAHQSKSADFVDVSLIHFVTEAAKKIFQHVRAVAEDAKKQQDLIQAVENGRVYLRLQLYGAANREFIRAAEMKTPEFQIDPELVRLAKSAYDDGRFSEAAHLFRSGIQELRKAVKFARRRITYE